MISSAIFAPTWLSSMLASLPIVQAEVAPDPFSLPPIDGTFAPASPLEIFHGYIAVFIAAFLVTVLATPIMRYLAVSNGIVDRPSEARKAHRVPVAYLGGVAVYLGLLGGVALAYVSWAMGWRIIEFHPSQHYDKLLDSNMPIVPLSVLLGMTVIMFTGLIDDVVGLDPRLKIGGQLLAAAALALDDVGTKVAAGVLRPFGRLIHNEDLVYTLHLPDFIGSLPIVGPTIEFDVIYWTGTAIIAIFVLGACNASNLIDGLDGLLSGVTGIAAIGLLVIALVLASHDDGQRDSARIIMALALLGACVGFLPHNFNPATIFLGDCGSLLLGYMSIAIILSLGDTGKTHLVIAGLIIYAIPIIDTILAIVRRKMAGLPMSAPDAHHLHHMLKRSLGVKGAVFTLYGIGIVFAGLGIWISMGRLRVVLTVAMVVTFFIGITAVKVARRQIIEDQTLEFEKRREAGISGRPGSEQRKRRRFGRGRKAHAEAEDSSGSEPTPTT